MLSQTDWARYWLASGQTNKMPRPDFFSANQISSKKNIVMDTQIVRNKNTFRTLLAAGTAAGALLSAPLPSLAQQPKGNPVDIVLGNVPVLDPAKLPACKEGTLQSYADLNSNLPGAPGGCTLGPYVFTDFAFPGITNGSTGGVTASDVRVTPALTAEGPRLTFSAVWNAGADEAKNLHADWHYVAVAPGKTPPFRGATLTIAGTQSEIVAEDQLKGARFVGAFAFGCLGAYGPCGTLNRPGAPGNGIQPFSLAVLALPPVVNPSEATATEQFLDPAGKPDPATSILLYGVIALAGGGTSPGATSPSEITEVQNLLITRAPIPVPGPGFPR